MRITTACPAELISEANMLAMIWGQGPEDQLTYRGCNWVDEQGHTYAVASWEAAEDWDKTFLVASDAAVLENLRPDWDAGILIDMQAAARAQGVISYWTPADLPTSPPQASPGTLVLIAGLDAAEALTALGLSHATPA